MTELTIHIDKVSKSTRIISEDVIASREEVALFLYGLLSTEAPSFVIKNHDGMVAEIIPTNFTWNVDHFEGTLDLNTEELVEAFDGASDRAFKRFSIFAYGDNVLYLNDTIEIMNTPYEDGMTSPSPAGSVYVTEEELEAYFPVNINGVQNGDILVYDTASSNFRLRTPEQVAVDVDWGDIGGTLSDQIDLQNALNGKVDNSQVLTNVPSGADFSSHIPINNHIADTSNPHNVNSTDVGLGNVDNTSDSDKVVSGPIYNALELKSPIEKPSFTYNDSYAFSATAYGLYAPRLEADQFTLNVANYTPQWSADGTGLKIGHDSPSRNLALQTNSIDRLIISSNGDIDIPGNVTGLNKNMIDLGNVDDTSDLDKPVSIATQTSLDNLPTVFQEYHAISGTDLNSAVSPGIFYVDKGTVSNTPESISGTVFISSEGDYGYLVFQKFVNYNTGRTFFRVSENTGSTWSSWSEVATTSSLSAGLADINNLQGKPVVNDLPGNSGDVLTYDGVNLKLSAPVAGGSNAEQIRNVSVKSTLSSVISSGEILSYDGSEFVNVSVNAKSLQGKDLISNLPGNSGDVLTYDGVNLKLSAPVAGGSNAEQIRNVSVKSTLSSVISSGEILSYDGSEFVNLVLSTVYQKYSSSSYTDLNNAIDPGLFYFPVGTGNLPYNAEGVLFVKRFGVSIIHTFSLISSNRVFARYSDTTGTSWSSWEELATVSALDLKAPIDNPVFTYDGSYAFSAMPYGLYAPRLEADQFTLNVANYTPQWSADGTGLKIGHDSPSRNLALQTNSIDRLIISGSGAVSVLGDLDVGGTVSGIDKSYIGLNNVDNTSDLDKPISDDTQTVLDLKSPIEKPSFTYNDSYAFSATAYGLYAPRLEADQFTLNVANYTPQWSADGTGLKIGHDSPSRNLALQTNSIDRLIISGAGDVDIPGDLTVNSSFSRTHYVDLIADLPTDDTNYKNVYVKGYNTIGDGGGGLFRYVSSQSAVNDGGVIINGWIRQYSGDVVDVDWFGAKANDITFDIGLHITNILDKGYRKIKATKLYYIMTGILIYYNDVSLFFTGSEFRFSSIPTSTIFSVYIAGSLNPGRVIKNLFIDGMFLNANIVFSSDPITDVQTIYGIATYSSTNDNTVISECVFQNCRFEGTSTAFFLRGYNPDATYHVMSDLVKNGKIFDNDGTPVDINFNNMNALGDGRNKIINNTIKDCLGTTRTGSGAAHAIYCGGSYFIISGNHISNMQGGILGPSHSVVSNNIILNCYHDNGIYASGSQNCTITGNYIENTKADGIGTNHTYNCTISDNIIIGWGNAAQRFQSSHNIVFSNNICYAKSFSAHFVRCYVNTGDPKSKNCSVFGNHFIGFLDINDDIIALSGNPIYIGDNFEGDLLIQNNIFENLDLTASPYPGKIILGDPAQNTYVKDNVFDAVTKYGAGDFSQYCPNCINGGNVIKNIGDSIIDQRFVV